MTTETLTLTDFLLARIEEDEAIERAGVLEGEMVGVPIGDRAGVEAALDKTLSAQVTALRYALARLGWALMGSIPHLGASASRTRAAQYADHEDYRAEWAL